jgi:hypothetical protein
LMCIWHTWHLKTPDVSIRWRSERCSCLRHCATRQEIPGSIPGGVHSASDINGGAWSPTFHPLWASTNLLRESFYIYPWQNGQYTT